MAMKGASLAILFVALLLVFSHAFARELDEKQNVENAENVKHVDQHGGGYCRYHCHGKCCSAEEFAEENAENVKDVDQYGGGHGYGGGGYCRHRCHGRCCSAEEFAEFVLAQNQPHN